MILSVALAILLLKKMKQNILLENVEHCGGEPEQADTGYYVTDR